MKTTAIVVLVFAVLRADGQMLQGVAIDPPLISVTAGSTVVVRANGKAGCCSHFPWRVVFRSEDNAIAVVDGILEEPAFAADVKVYARNAGVTNIVSPAIGNGTWPLARIEVMPAMPLVAEKPEVATTAGRPVTLRVIADRAVSQTFSWYLGHTGDITQPLTGNGPELSFTAEKAGTYYAWAMAVASYGANTVEFRIDVVPPHRRRVRH